MLSINSGLLVVIGNTKLRDNDDGTTCPFEKGLIVNTKTVDPEFAGIYHRHNTAFDDP